MTVGIMASIRAVMQEKAKDLDWKNTAIKGGNGSEVQQSAAARVPLIRSGKSSATASAAGNREPVAGSGTCFCLLTSLSLSHIPARQSAPQLMQAQLISS